MVKILLISLVLVGCCSKQSSGQFLPSHISNDNTQPTQVIGACRYTEIMPTPGYNKMTVIECNYPNGKRTIKVRE